MKIPTEDGSVDIHIKWIKERIAQLRIQKGISERELSAEIGKGHTYISDMNYRAFNPSMQTLLSICEYFDVTPSEFFDTDNKKPKTEKDIIRELQRLFGANYVKLPEFLAELTPDDIKHIIQITHKIAKLK